mgnify:CR=1 FL=1|jgi:hypothetical protein|tara:strand:- start:4485 stop:5183 length:699 start_codon:yes stop_codon:yes gene_type:complete
MDFFIDETFEYKQYRNKSVLVIGGGPSTLEVNWKNLNVDYVWSCTNFFLNSDITSEDIDLVSLGNLQDYRDKRLTSYLDTHINCKVLFENNYLYSETLTKNQDFLATYRDRIHYGELNKEYTGIVGPPARMVTLAANVGFKDIYFVGIDGFNPELKNTHAFTNEDGLREGAVHSTYEKYFDAHTLFANNIHRDFANRVNFHNLGEAADSHNIISFVSEKKFKLKKELYEKLK